MKAKLTLGVCACALAFQLAVRPAVAVDGPERPHPVRKSSPAAPSHSKAVSLAPRPHSGRRSYGAPIPQPIVKNHTPAKHESPPRKPTGP